MKDITDTCVMTLAHCDNHAMWDLNRDRPAEQSNDYIEVIGLRRPWLLWVVSFPVWTFIALVMDLSIYSYNKSFSIPTTHYALSVPVYNSLIFALLAPG